MEKQSLAEIRKEIRTSYLNNDYKHLSDYELLEKVICLSCDKCDYRLVTKNLFNTYHTLDRILKAPPRQLVHIDGVGETTAVYISCLGALRQRISENRNNEIFDFSSTENRKIYARNALRYLPQEHIIMLNLDKSKRLINKYELASGSVSSCSISPHEMAKHIVFDQPCYVMFAHNHPDGNAEPSNNDIMFSQNTANWLKGFKIGMLDHIIVSQEDSLSMREHSISKNCVDWSS